MAQKKWTPKRAKNAFFVVLKSSSFPTEKKKAKSVVSARKSRQQLGLKANNCIDPKVGLGIHSQKKYIIFCSSVPDLSSFLKYVISCVLSMPWKLKPGFINRALVAVIFEASKCL